MRRLAVIALVALAACAAEEDPDAPIEVAYACEGGTEFTVVFNPVSRIATVLGLGPVGILLPQLPTGSGFLYATDRVSLGGKGDEATITVDGASRRCRAVGGVAAAAPGG